MAEPKGLRGPGLHLPGVKATGPSGVRATGTLHRDGQRQYWNVSRGHQGIEVELAGAAYDRLYLTVGDARVVVDRINAAGAP